MLRHTRIDSPVGELLLVADDGGLCGLYFEGHWYPPEEIGPAEPSEPVFAAAAAQLAEYFAGERQAFDLPLATAGNELSEAVWRMLQEIPHGATTTYGELATRLGNRALAQRVGQAVGHNPVSIVIPCHRVLGADGSLTGYAGGLDRKRFLLDLERPSADAEGRLF